MRRFLQQILKTVRADSWWPAKLSPSLAVFYATTIGSNGKSPAASALVFLGAMIVCASFVSVLNDVCDRADDLAVGKPNPAISRSAAAHIMWMAALVASGLLVLYVWRSAPVLCVCYCGSWIVFLLYSMPPIRLKEHGVLGVFADAAGAHLFPALTAVFAASLQRGASPQALWTIVVAIWSFCWGVRGIIWHQIGDVEHDTTTQTRTFVQRHSAPSAVALASRVFFPVEFIAFVALLYLTQSVIVAASFGVYIAIQLLQAYRLRSWPPIVTPRPLRQLALQDYYTKYFLIALALTGLLEHRDWAMSVVASVVVGPYALLKFARWFTRSQRLSSTRKAKSA